MTISVWMDSWQLQCCGEPFRIGAHVSWGLTCDRDLRWLADVLTPTAVRVHAAEDHHGGVTTPMNGTVTRIRALHCRCDPGPVPGSGQLTDIDEAVKWAADHGDLRFTGYVVELQQHQSA